MIDQVNYQNELGLLEERIKSAYQLAYHTKLAIEEFNNLYHKLIAVYYEIDKHDDILGDLFDSYNSAIDVSEDDNERECFVYYILNGEKEKVKIGISYNPEGRAKQLQTANGEELEILHTIKFKNRKTAQTVENMLHNEFARWRKQSSVTRSVEWFDAVIIKWLKEHYWKEEDFKSWTEVQSEEE